MNHAETIIKLSSEYWGVSVENIKQPDKIRGARKSEFVLARQVAMSVIKDFTDYSLKSIGSFFSGRDHATVLHAITAIQDKEDTDSGFAERLYLFKEIVMNNVSVKYRHIPNDVDNELSYLI